MATTETTRGRARGDDALFDRPEPMTGRILTAIYGAIFLAVGIWGFALTGFDGDWFADDTGEEVLGLFEVNPFHNLAHVLFGVIGLVAAARLLWSFLWNVATVVSYLALAVYGLFAVDESWDILAINVADNWLHAALTLLAAGIAAVCWWELRQVREIYDPGQRDVTGVRRTAR